MKRIGELWPTLVSYENLLLAYRKARRGKRTEAAVERFEFRREHELVRLQRELTDGTYRPGPYHTFTLHDTKPRLISAAPFRDRVVHHAFCNVVEPIFERTFIFDSYASRCGKGTHAAVKRYQHFAQSRKYVLKCDVRRFFPSIDHQLLQVRLERKLKDRRVLDLAATIIAHSNAQVDVPGLFPGDDLFTQSERRRGLPIGNQTSQFFGNVCLDGLDHFMKEALHCRAYIRYVDDFVVLDNDKAHLAEIRTAIERFLLTQRLWLHPTKRVISRVEDGLPFLGYRVWPTHRRLTKLGLRRFRRRMRRYQRWFHQGVLTATELTQRMRAWIGHAQQADSWRLRTDLFRRIVFVGPQAEQPRASWWQLEQQREEHSFCQPQQEHAGQPEQQHWFPCIEHSAPAMSREGQNR